MGFFVQRGGGGGGQKAGFRVMLKYFEIKRLFVIILNKQITCCRASDSVIDHRRRRNVLRALVTHSATLRVPLICSYDILTLSVIYY